MPVPWLLSERHLETDTKYPSLKHCLNQKFQVLVGVEGEGSGQASWKGQGNPGLGTLPGATVPLAPDV